jgi:hypothetical protein
MEKIFDSVIDDQFVIKMTDTFAGALNGVNGLINGFGGLGGIMGTVSSIFMSKYAKEMPKVLNELKYNVDYLLNGKLGTLDTKQNNVFKSAEKGLDVFAKANGASMDTDTGMYLGGDDLVLTE